MRATSILVRAAAASAALAPLARTQFQHVDPQHRGAAAELDWVQRYDHGIQGHDNAAAVAVDSQGNVLACGSSLGQYGSSYVYDTTTVKHSPTGALLWEQRYHGPGSGFQSGAVALAVDAADAAYVLANDPGSSGNQDILLLKYDSGGAEQWLRRFDNNWSEGGVGVVVDANQDVYVAASSYYAGNVTDIVLLKYDAGGTLLWSRNWHGGFGTDWPVGLALDPHGNVDVVGNTINVSAGTNFDWVVLEYDPAGTLLWTRKLSGLLQAPDYSNAMAVAPNGDVVATGYLVQTSGNQHFTTACWTDLGTPRWTSTFATPSGTGKSIGFDALGRVHVAGQPGLVAYDLAGGVRWQRAFAVQGAAWSTASFVARLPAGRLALGGSGYFTGPGNEFALQVLDSAGHVLEELVVGVPNAATPTGIVCSGDRVLFHGSGSNGHDNDMVTAAARVR